MRSICHQIHQKTTFWKVYQKVAFLIFSLQAKVLGVCGGPLRLQLGQGGLAKRNLSSLTPNAKRWVWPRNFDGYIEKHLNMVKQYDDAAGLFLLQGLGCTLHIHGIIDSRKYQKILNLAPSAKKLKLGRGWIFQQKQIPKAHIKMLKWTYTN